MDKRSTALIGLGSNLGDRASNIRFGIAEIERLPGTRISAVSSLYESAAHTIDENEIQPDYLNAAALLETTLSPHDLLERCLEIERARDRLRDRDQRWQSRRLDLDILVFGRETIFDERLTVPHPLLGQRRFVLAPLMEIAPELHIPAPFDAPVQYLLEHCTDTTIVEIVSIGRDRESTE